MRLVLVPGVKLGLTDTKRSAGLKLPPQWTQQVLALAENIISFSQAVLFRNVDIHKNATVQGLAARRLQSRLVSD